MKKGLTIFLQVIIALIGIGTLAAMLWEPHLEGRNAHVTLFEIYFKDPFLAYVYLASISFFVALYQAFKILGYAGQNKVFSQAAVKALRTIKYCAMILIAFIMGAEIHSFIVVRGHDDVAGSVMMGFFLMLSSAIVAATATVFQKLLQRTIELKSENELTV